MFVWWGGALAVWADMLFAAGVRGGGILAVWADMLFAAGVRVVARRTLAVWADMLFTAGVRDKHICKTIPK